MTDYVVIFTWVDLTAINENIWQLMSSPRRNFKSRVVNYSKASIKCWYQKAGEAGVRNAVA